MCSLELPLWRSVLGNLDDKRNKQTWCPPPPGGWEGGGGTDFGAMGGPTKLGFKRGEIVIFPHLILLANISYNVDSAQVGDKVQRLGEKVQKCEYTMRN